MPEFLIFVLIAAVAGLAIWWGVVHERKRREALLAWSASEGWDFQPEKVAEPRYRYDLFDNGHSRWLRYSAAKDFPAPTPGLGDVRLILFEYHYAITTSTGKHTHTHHYYLTCAVTEPPVDLGAVVLRREGWGDKLVQAIGFDDIDLEDPEFSKRFVVKARDRKDAYDLLDGAMMRFLCERGGPSLETHGRELFVHVSGQVSPERFDALASFVLGFLAQIPRTLVNAERARLGEPPLVEAGNASTSSREALDPIGGS